METEMAAPVYIIYHDECRDGFGAAWAAFTALGRRTPGGNPVYYRGCKHGDHIPMMEADGRVYLLDFSYSLEIMKALHERHGGRVMVLDHHQTARDELEGKVPNCIIDMNRSGAAIAWGYFHPREPLPELLAYVQDRDLWTWQLPDSREINAALEEEPMTFTHWSNLSVDHLRMKGESIRSRVRLIIVDNLKRETTRTIAGTKVPAVEASEHVSETAEALLERHPEAPFVAVWRRHRKADGRQVNQYSLRSAGQTDVAKIAESLGGGGHAAAAGFQQEIPDQMEEQACPRPSTTRCSAP